MVYNLFLLLQIVLSYALGSTLAVMWAALNGITVLAYIAMFNITFPANYNVMNHILIQLATFDVVPRIDDINDWFFTTLYSEGPIEQPAIGFGLNGFESQNYTKNTGSLYIFVLWALFTNIFFRIVRWLAFRYILVRFYQKYRTNENLNAIYTKLVL
jgi:hypothetical protein